MSRLSRLRQADEIKLLPCSDPRLGRIIRKITPSHNRQHKHKPLRTGKKHIGPARLIVPTLVGFARAAQRVGSLRQGAKSTSFFDSRLIELQKEYAQQLLTHLNPYTKLKYTEDPAVAIVEINNENAINVGFHATSPFYQDELTSLYNQWLIKHRSQTQLTALRAIAGVGPDAPVPLLASKAQAAKAPAERFYAEAEFYNHLQRDYYSASAQATSRGEGRWWVAQPGARTMLDRPRRW